MDSTRVYQGVVGGVDARLIAALEDAVVAQTRPDLTLILDVPAEIGLARAHARQGEPDRFGVATWPSMRRCGPVSWQLQPMSRSAVLSSIPTGTRKRSSPAFSPRSSRGLATGYRT